MSALRASALSAAFAGGRCGAVSFGRAESGMVKLDVTGLGWARATDGGTEGSSLPAILMDGYGEARPGQARSGMARRCAARLGNS